jgi:hypothetical protein
MSSVGGWSRTHPVHHERLILVLGSAYAITAVASIEYS